jgi:hypothetical protein
MSLYDLIQNVLIAGVVIWLICGRAPVRAVLSRRKQVWRMLNGKSVIGNLDKVMADTLDCGSLAREAPYRTFSVRHDLDVADVTVGQAAPMSARMNTARTFSSKSGYELDRPHRRDQPGA